MKLLFLDLETTGLPKTIGYSMYHPYQQIIYYDSSRIVQIALLVYEKILTDNEAIDNLISEIVDHTVNNTNANANRTLVERKINTENFKLIKEHNYIIKPDNYEIKNDKIHNISHQMAEFVGIPFIDAIKNIKDDLATGDLLVAHNLIFDKNVLLSELYRYNLHDECKLVNDLPTFCTSVNCAHITKIRYNNREFKQPKLSELYRHLFNSDATNLHDALQDTRVMVKIFFELLRRKIIVLV